MILIFFNPILKHADLSAKNAHHVWQVYRICSARPSIIGSQALKKESSGVSKTNQKKPENDKYDSVSKIWFEGFQPLFGFIRTGQG